MQIPANSPPAAELFQQILDFQRAHDALMLSTINPDGSPDASHAAYLCGADGSLYFFLSDLSSHTANLLANPRAAALIVSNRGDAFARPRLSLKGGVVRLPRDDAAGAELLDQFAARHGKIVGLLRQLGDFHLFQMQPDEALLVMGFGKAWPLAGEQLRALRAAAAS
jgi:hypothetical protein